MQRVAERIIDGSTATVSRTRPWMPSCLLARRQLADLPGLLRPADRHGDGVGQVTNAVFGFTSMLINLLRDHQPDGVARRLRPAGADLPPRARSPTTRPTATAAPDILRQQMGLVRQVVETLGIPIVELPGFEADDIIATLATQAATTATTSSIVTGDRDSYQLVEDPHVKVLYNRRGVSRLRALRRGRHRGAHRRHARRSTRSTRRCAATRPTTCPACRAWARRPRPS